MKGKALNRCLKIGDRVHFPGDPADTGTVTKYHAIGPKKSLVYMTIEWDNKIDAHDACTVTRRGRLIDLDSGFVSLIGEKPE